VKNPRYGGKHEDRPSQLNQCETAKDTKQAELTTEAKDYY
jgi:hypothetical protein